MLKRLLRAGIAFYLGVGVGTVIGAVVATITTMTLYGRFPCGI